MTKITTGILVLFLFLSFSEAKKEPIDCRVIVGGMTECMPYSPKFLKTKEVTFQKSKKRLIVDKTLPVPQKKPHIKVISVEDMIERYVKVEDSKRFRGTIDQKYFKKPVKIKAKIEKKPSSEPKELTPKVAPPLKEQNMTKPEVTKTPVIEEGVYVVKSGDVLSKIALMFGMKTKELMSQNGLKKKDQLRIGERLQLPLSQEKIDAIVSASYKVKAGDNLISIAKKFNLDPKELASYNDIKNTAQVTEGKMLKLPLPYVKLAEKRKKEQKLALKKGRRKTYSSKLIHGFGKRRLRVTATAYSSHGNQTDSTPFLAAWNNRLRPGMKVIAVSRDLLYKYGMRNGTKVRISGLPGIYRVRDKMNKRYKKRIDIYMGLDRRRALRWGRRSVVIYW